MASSQHFYQRAGHTPVWKVAKFDGAGTITIWTPTTSTKIVLTDIVASSINGGSVAFYWGNLAGSKIVDFHVGGSATVNPGIGAVECTAYDRTLVGNVSGGGTDGFKVTVFGFELP